MYLCEIKVTLESSFHTDQPNTLGASTAIAGNERWWDEEARTLFGFFAARFACLMAAFRKCYTQACKSRHLLIVEPLVSKFVNDMSLGGHSFTYPAPIFTVI